MRSMLSLSIPALAVATVALTASEAHAARGIMLITHGDDVRHYADLSGESAALAAEATGREVQVGYLYSHFGVFWLELWTWDGRYCLYQGDDVWDLSPEEAAKLIGVEVDALGKPFLYQVPLGILVLLGLGLGLGLLYRFSGD